MIDALTMLGAGLDAGALLAAVDFGYRPFVDPINAFHDWWWALLVPLALGVSAVYKATRVPTMRPASRYVRETAIMTTQIVVSLVLLGAAVYLFIDFYARFIADHAG